MVSSTIVQETVSQILSGLFKQYGSKGKSKTNEDLERLEMAHIKLEAALETSDKWEITEASLLRWRKKLKRAAQECTDTLHKCKQRILEEDQVALEVRNSSFPKRVAQTTKSLVFPIFFCNKDDSIRSIVRRFEWFADGASEFLRFLELGGTPRYVRLFDPLIRHLLTGKKLQHKIVRANKCPLYLVWMPFITAEYGIEATLIFMQNDVSVPENGFFLSLMLQLSESTDIVGIAIKCLQLFDPVFKSKVETIRDELMQLPTQDLSWVPNVDTDQKEHWDNIHSLGSQWFRPNPLCCKHHDRHGLHQDSMRNMSELSDGSLDSVIEVNLQCRVSPIEYNRQRTSLSDGGGSRQDPQQLRVGVLFMPHGSSEDQLLVNTSSAAHVVNGEENCLHTDITWQQLEEIMLPVAVDYFQQNIHASVYQMLWRSKHGVVYAQVMNASKRKTILRDRKGRLLRREYQYLGSQTRVVHHFIESWFMHAPIRLQGSIAKWIQKEKENKLAPLPLSLKF
ncbi:hypothetical protein HU200_048731 [Digitaria exilis]|uniref:Rx N-terminal domain-containing protein n=1 Tax=Digitaria exilis TaxID=1010633 RepID=A0A835B0N3_9POAL|nr:hypothetical protein HU200_048731 [Digitaria exilis]